MSYFINQEVIFRSVVTGEKEKAKIIARKIDFENGIISTDRSFGKFDYLVSIEKNNGKIEEHFCNENDFEIINKQ